MGKNDCIGGGIFACFGILIWVLTFSFPVLEGIGGGRAHPGPSLFPQVLGTLFIIFGSIIIYSGWRTSKLPPPPPPPEEEDGVKIAPLNYFNPILVIILIAAFIALAPKLGFIITGAAVLAVLMIKLHVKPLKSVIVSVCVICLIYFIFSKFLRVPLPQGILAPLGF
jgi:putative tricarboxylic transport membrane protein